MLIYTLPSGDEVHRYQRSLILCFKGKRKVLSTTAHLGGIQNNLTEIFNQDSKPSAGMPCEFYGNSYEEHLQITAEKLGLNPKTSTGMTTAATMTNVAIKTLTFANTTVTAIVTGGIESNGGRVGDYAQWTEGLEVENANSENLNTENAHFENTDIENTDTENTNTEKNNGNVGHGKTGTINIIVVIEGDLTDGALARALVTCTEAKTAAIQELLAPSRYSRGLATGSGTDGTFIVSNPSSKLKLTDAGKHSKLGELIGKTVMSALKETVSKQSDLNPKTQHHIVRRMDRFGVTQESLWQSYLVADGKMQKPNFVNELEIVGSQNQLLTYTSLYAHLLDQLMWDLLAPDEAVEAGLKILALMENKHSEKVEKWQENKEQTIEFMIEKYQTLIVKILLKL